MLMVQFSPPKIQGVHGSEEHTSELQSPCNLVCRLLLEKIKNRRGPSPIAFHREPFSVKRPVFYALCLPVLFRHRQRARDSVPVGAPLHPYEVARPHVSM